MGIQRVLVTSCVLRYGPHCVGCQDPQTLFVQNIKKVRQVNTLSWPFKFYLPTSLVTACGVNGNDPSTISSK